METALKKDIYGGLACAWSGTVSRELTGECVVPDTMPDVGTVVDADGILTLRGKTTEAGSVSLSAAVSVWVLYMPEDGGAMRSLEMTIPTDIRMEASAVDSDCQTVARLRLRAMDARALNSRKVSVRADVEASVQCYRPEPLSLAGGLEQDNGSVQLLRKTASLLRLSDVGEKTFVVTDEYQLPAGCGGVERILSQRVEAVVEDVKYVSGKAVFRGRVRAWLLFAAAQESLFAGRYETEFSQIMELAAEGAEAVPSVSLVFTGAYFDLPERGQANGRVSAELHLAAQAVCRQRQEAAYIADLYSNRTALVPSYRSLSAVADMRPVSLRQTVAGRAEPFSGDGEVLSLTACVGDLTVEDGAVRTTVNIRLLSRQAGGQCSVARCRLGAEFTTNDLPAGAALESVTVTATDVYYAPGNGGADVRVTLQMDALAVTEESVMAVDEVTEDPAAWEQEKNMPSVSLLWARPGTDLWQVARRYHSTLEAIAMANEGREEGLLLIPKGR
jgi:hypothetical protein